MEVTVDIPDTIRERLGKGIEQIPRWLLEKAGLEAYRSREISGYELRLMLGMKSRLELEKFLKSHGIHLEYTEEDLAHDAETSRQLKRKPRQPG
jgi:predicted HTH domain antitoxin